MSKVLRIGAAVASIAALVPGPQQIFLQAAAVGLQIGAQITAKKPGIRGSAAQITIGANQPTPYAMGRTAAQLAQVLEKGYGGRVNGVDNPYKTYAYVASIGPVGSIEAIQMDFTTISFAGGTAGGAATGYYGGWLWADTQIGACPEASALAGPFGAIPDWSAAHKLSGLCALMFTFKYDKKGKVYASGLPQPGAILGEAVQVYDQRQDDTYPGGSGDCRALDEETYVGGDAAHNPSCHGVTYALGRWQGTAGPDGAPRKVMGCGFSVDSIDWPAWTEFANTCDANNWKIGGSVFEPGNRWDNLKRICAAGGGVPVWTGGLLSVLFPRPRIALDTISRHDLADGEIRIPAMKGWEQRLNGIIPKYPSEQNRWEMVQSDLVTSTTYLEEDGGEEKHEERPFELVPYKDQAAQLGAYELTDGREIDGMVFPCKPRLMAYKIGDALETDADLEEDTGLAAGTLLVITGRSRDPATATVTLTFATETTAKHDFALGRTGTAPPSPTLPTGEEMDDAASVLSEDTVSSLIDNSSTVPTVIGGATDTEITIDDHARRYRDKQVPLDGVSITEDTDSDPLVAEETYALCYDDEEREGGLRTWMAYRVSTTGGGDAYTSPDHPYRHFGGYITMDVVGGDGVRGGGAYPSASTIGGEIGEA